MTPAERVSNILADGGNERVRAAAWKLPGIVGTKAASGVQKVIMLQRVADELAAVAAPHTICRKGCSHCCHQHVMISELEARAIEQATGRERHQVPNVGLDLVRVTHDKQRQYLGVPCTFLGPDGACSIYEHRPIKCRTHFSLADDPALCSTSRGLGVRDLPLYHNEPIEAATVQVTYRSAMADIREFFPKGE